MTRHAVDLKPILKIIAGENSEKLNLDKPVDINKLKFFYQFSSEAPVTDAVDPDILMAMKKVVEFLDVKYNIKAEEKKFAMLRKSAPIWFATMSRKTVGGKMSFGDYIMKKPTVPCILIEIVKNLFGFSGNTLIALLTALFDFSSVVKGSKKYNRYTTIRDDLEKHFKDMLGDDGVFLYPTHPTPAPYHNEPVLKPLNFSYTAIVNCLGFPATNIPLGLSREGLPIGIQVIANHNNDRLCFAVAEELDKAFGGWVEPQKS